MKGITEPAVSLLYSAALGRSRQVGTVRRWMKRHRLSILSCVTALAAWETVARVVDFPFLPAVTQVLVALWRITANGAAANALAESVMALLAGMIIAVAAGIAVGALTGLSLTARLALSVYLDALMAAPVTAFVPLFILLFGLGSETRIIIVALFAFFPIAVNTQAGMMAADPELIAMARAFGARPLQIFLRVRLPMSSPEIEAGLRMAMARGVEGLIVGETLIAATGLGGLLSRYHQTFSIDSLFAVVVVIVATAFAGQALTEILCRLLIGPRH